MNRDELNDLLEQQFAKFAGRIIRHVDAQVDEVKGEMDFDRLAVLMDGLAKRLEDE